MADRFLGLHKLRGVEVGTLISYARHLPILLRNTQYIEG
jgi:hypothetical protein